MTRKLRNTLLQICGMALVTALLLTVVEGLASFTLTMYEASKVVAGRRPHTGYDPELGWVGMPNVYLPDGFGKGVYVRTNSRGFRSNREYSPVPPPDKLRVVCSGDSFTFGFGVDNDHTWCRGLEQRDARMETINLGQTGYGIDQAYLWYLRAGAGLQPSVHVFAFIARDLIRMAMTDFQGYAKPVLKLKNGKLAVGNTPVPRVAWSRRLAGLEQLSSIQLLRRAVERFAPASALAAGPDDAAVRPLAVKVFEELQALHRKQNQLLVVVYLPWAEDLTPDAVNDERRNFLRREAARLGIVYFDLTDAIRALGPRDGEALFIREKAPWPQIGVWGHYNNDGNRFVRDELYRRLIEQPAFAQRIGRL